MEESSLLSGWQRRCMKKRRRKRSQLKRALPQPLRRQAATHKQSMLIDHRPWLLNRDAEARRDPFDPHEEALFVQDLGPDHKLLLNKFNVVAHHCLVVTKSGRCAMLH